MAKYYKIKTDSTDIIGFVFEAMEFNDINKEQVFSWIDGTQKSPDRDENDNPIIKLGTSSGVKIATLGDFIVRETNREYHPYKPDIFKETFSEIL